MARGRPRAPGKVYYLGRLRFRPGIDPPELEEILEAIMQAGPGKRADILRAALQGGAGLARKEADSAEDSSTRNLLDEMFSQF